MSFFKRSSVSSVGATPKDVERLAERAKDLGAGEARVQAWDSNHADSQGNKTGQTGVSQEIFNKDGQLVHYFGHNRASRTEIVGGKRVLIEEITGTDGRTHQVVSGEGKLPGGGHWKLVSMGERVRHEWEED